MKIHRFGALGVLIAVLLAALAAATSAAAAPVTVNLRIEGSSSTIFEGPVTTDAKTIGGHPCDGTNGGANATPGPTMTSRARRRVDPPRLPLVGHLVRRLSTTSGSTASARTPATRASSGGFALQLAVHERRRLPAGGAGRRQTCCSDSTTSRSRTCSSSPDRPARRWDSRWRSRSSTARTARPSPAPPWAGRPPRANGSATVTYSSPGMVHLKAERSDSSARTRSTSASTRRAARNVDRRQPPIERRGRRDHRQAAAGRRDQGDPNHKHFRRHGPAQAGRGAASDAGGLFQVYFRLRRFTHPAASGTARSARCSRTAHRTAQGALPAPRDGSDAGRTCCPRRLPRAATSWRRRRSTGPTTRRARA